MGANMANGNPVLMSSDCIYIFKEKRFEALQQLTSVLLNSIGELRIFGAKHRMALKTKVEKTNINDITQINEIIDQYKIKAEEMGYNYLDAGFDGGFFIDTVIPEDYYTFVLNFNALFFISERDGHLQRYMKKHNDHAHENVNQITTMMKHIGSIPIIKELWSYEIKKILFVGEPYLWYRPKSIFDIIEDVVQSEEVIDSFWKMYNVITESIPSELITDILKSNSVEYEELGNGKIYVRLCTTFDDIVFKSKPILLEIEEKVNDYLDENGINRNW
jgi:hypothetical protein